MKSPIQSHVRFSSWSSANELMCMMTWCETHLFKLLRIYWKCSESSVSDPDMMLSKSERSIFPNKKVTVFWKIPIFFWIFVNIFLGSKIWTRHVVARSALYVHRIKNFTWSKSVCVSVCVSVRHAKIEQKSCYKSELALVYDESQ